MRTIPKPTLEAKKVFLECISTVQNNQLKMEYIACQDKIETAEGEFNRQFPLNKMYEIQQNLNVHGEIGKAEMEKVYTYRMVTLGMPGNKYYNILKSSAPYGKCPLCSVRNVDTLDHYLPKSKYPVFAVVPINLIPACTPCNIGKRISFPSNGIEQTFHPYYDDVQNELWIKANILQTNPISFDYFVDCPNDWSQIKIERAQNHFNSFNLNELFTSHANEELRGSKLHLQKLYELSPDLLVEHLNDAHSSRRDTLGINSWQSIMYFSLLNNNWFIQGGIMSF